MGDGLEEAGGVDGFTEGEPAGGEDDDGPEEVVEVVLGEDAGAEEEDDGDDGDNAHVAEDVFELVRDAPEDDGDEGCDHDEVLDAGEGVLCGADRDDGGVVADAECYEQHRPDEEDADDADGERDEEPRAPARRRAHVFQRDDILRGSDRGSHTADIGGECDPEDECL